MKYLPFLNFLAVALAGQSISPVLIRSGSQYQYAELGYEGINVVPNASNKLKLVLNSDGSLIDSVTKKYLNIGSDGYITLSEKPQTGYAIDDTHLTFNQNEEFGVQDHKFAFNRRDPDFWNVAVRVIGFEETDDVVPKKTKIAETGSDKSETDKSETDKSETDKIEADKIEAVEIKSPESDIETPESDIETPESDIETPGIESVERTVIKPRPEGMFGLLAVHTGSRIHLSPIKKISSAKVFGLGGNESEELMLQFGEDNTTLYDQRGRGINLDQNTGRLGEVTPFGHETATPGFSIQDNYLTYNGNRAWRACPSENGYYVSEKKCAGEITVALWVV